MEFICSFVFFQVCSWTVIWASHNRTCFEQQSFSVDLAGSSHSSFLDASSQTQEIFITGWLRLSMSKTPKLNKKKKHFCSPTSWASSYPSHTNTAPVFLPAYSYGAMVSPRQPLFTTLDCRRELILATAVNVGSTHTMDEWPQGTELNRNDKVQRRCFYCFCFIYQVSKVR